MYHIFFSLNSLILFVRKAYDPSSGSIAENIKNKAEPKSYRINQTIIGLRVLFIRRQTHGITQSHLVG